MGRKFQIKRGNEADIPILAPGEMGFTLDSKKLFVGTGSQNVPINSSALQEDANGNINMKGNLTLKGSGNYGSKINFGDGDYVHISEPADDTLEIKGTRVNLVGTVNATTAASGTSTTQIATTEFVQNALAAGSLPAGSGNFDRTIFERSSVDYSTGINSRKNYVLGKFIVPEDGIYKISFDYKIYYPSGDTIMRTLYLDLEGSYSSQFDNNYVLSDWYLNTSVGDGITRVSGGTTIRKLLAFASLSTNVTEWENVVHYFYIRKGMPAVLTGSRDNLSSSETLVLTFRNVKVLY